MFTMVTVFTMFTGELGEQRDDGETLSNIYTPDTPSLDLTAKLP